MRTAFVRALERVVEHRPDLVLLTGDLGWGVLDTFAERWPAQYLNAGVAEQAMTGLAAGLALTGHKAVTYSIGNFPTLRCLEQLRNDVCHAGADVLVVAVGGGLAYGPLGYSHHAVEDLAVLRALPNLLVVAPGDPVEAEAATQALLEHRGPAYLRLGKAGEPVVEPSSVPFELGRGRRLRDGDDVTLLSTGGMLPVAVQAADLLAPEGLAAGVVSLHTVVPLDVDAVLEAARRGPVVTLEEHVLSGGLGSAVAEVLVDAGVRARVRRLGLAPQDPVGEIGSQAHLRRRYGLDVDTVVAKVRDLVGARDR